MSTSGGSSGGPVSIGGAGVSQLGGALVTLKADGSTRNTIDDGSGDMTAAGLLQGQRVQTDFALIWSASLITSSEVFNGFEGVVLVDASAGAVTVTLTSSVFGGQLIGVKKIDSSANAVTVAAPAGTTIDGAASKALAAQWDSVLLMAAEGEFYVIG